MNQRKRYLVILVLLTLMTSNTVSIKAEEVTNKITVDLKGLVCDFCSTAIKKTFKKVEAVSETHIDLTEKTLVIDLKPGQALSDEEIIKYVTNAGYNVESIRRE